MLKKEEVIIMAILHKIGKDEVHFVALGKTIQDAMDVVFDNNITGLPVVSDEGPVGVISLYDLAYAYHNRLDPDKEKVDAIMSGEVITVSPEDTVEDALKVLKDNHISRVPVLEDGKLIGFLTRRGINDAFDELAEAERLETQDSLMSYEM